MAVDVTGFERMRREQAKREAVKQEATLGDMTYNELKALAKEKGIQGHHKMKKQELIEALQEG